MGFHYFGPHLGCLHAGIVAPLSLPGSLPVPFSYPTKLKSQYYVQRKQWAMCFRRDLASLLARATLDKEPTGKKPVSLKIGKRS